jgi:hypothetical protein
MHILASFLSVVSLSLFLAIYGSESSSNNEGRFKEIR